MAILWLKNTELFSPTKSNEGKSAASFCRHLAALFTDMFSNFYLAKIPKVLKTQQPLKLKKTTTYFEPLEF